MEITISGNSVFYQENNLKEESVINKFYSISGDLGFNYLESNLKFSFNNEAVFILNAAETFKFANKIKGCKFDNVKNILSDYNVCIPNNISYFEISLIKALVNIYLWLEHSLIIPEEANIQENIYDQFIIDYSGKAEPQKDIYFLPEKYTDGNYDSMLSILIELNLICKLEIKLNKIFKSYFIPFLKPGVNKDIFSDKDKNKSNDLYIFWKELLSLRDSRIKLFFSNL